MEFNPFAPFEFLQPGPEPQSSESLSASELLKQLGLQCLVDQHGAAGARKLLNERSGGNAARYLRRFDATASLSTKVPDLFALYQQALKWQLS